MVRGSVGAVILNRHIERPSRSKRVGSIADCDIQMVLAIQILRGRRRAIKRENNMEPALRCGIEMAGGIGDGGPKLQRVRRRDR